jgi:hypothetical protein
MKHAHLRFEHPVRAPQARLERFEQLGSEREEGRKVEADEVRRFGRFVEESVGGDPEESSVSTRTWCEDDNEKGRTLAMRMSGV